MRLLNKNVVVFALLLASFETRAQHVLSATISGLKHQTVYLSGYTGLQLQRMDSTIADEQGGFVFDKIVEKGMYVLASRDFRLEWLYDGSPVQFVLPDLDELNTIHFVNSPLNERWLAYLMKREFYRHQKEVLKQVIRQYDPSTDFYRQAKLEFNAMQEDFGRFTDSLIALDDDYASLLIRNDRESPIDLEMKGSEQRAWLIDHFLDEVDFNDTDLIRTNVLTTKMVDYLSLFQGLDGVDSDVAFALGMDRLLAKAKVNMRMYEFVLEYMLEGFSALGLTAVTDYLLNYPQLGEGEITVEEGLRLDSIVEPYQKVRVGVAAPDYEGVTIDGKPYHLYDSKAKRIIVFFWSTDCEYCHDFLTSIRKKIDLNSDFELVTFALAENQEEVMEAVKKMKLPGYHFFDEKRWEGKAFLDYHVFSTPTALVLDADKTIVYKPYDWQDLRTWMKKKTK